jgi:hypothetical protein
MTASWAYALDSTGALVARVEGDDLLVRLAGLGFSVRRYGDRAGLDDNNDQGAVPSMALLYEFADQQDRYGELLVALGAPDMNAIRPEDRVGQRRKRR